MKSKLLVLLGTLAALGWVTGCGQASTTTQQERRSIGARIIAVDDTLRGVTCYRYSFGEALSCVKVRP